MEQTTPLIIASGTKISGLWKMHPIRPPKIPVMKRLRMLMFIVQVQFRYEGKHSHNALRILHRETLHYTFS